MPGWAGLGTLATSWLIPSLSMISGQEVRGEGEGNDRGGASPRAVALLFPATRNTASPSLGLQNLRVGRLLPGMGALAGVGGPQRGASASCHWQNSARSCPE